MGEFGYYFLFGACQNERRKSLWNYFLLKYFQQRTLQQSNKILLHQAISIISVVSGMAEAD